MAANTTSTSSSNTGANTQTSQSSQSTRGTQSSQTTQSAQGSQPHPQHHHLTSAQLDALSADAAEYPDVLAQHEKPVVGYGDLPNITRAPTQADHEAVARDTLDQMVATLKTDKAQKSNN